MKAYFQSNGTLVVEADTPIEAFALRQWVKSREDGPQPSGLPLLMKFDAVVNSEKAP